MAGAVVLVAAVAAAFVALGSTNSPVSDPIAQAATLSSTAPGYRMNFALSISAPGLGQPVAGSGSAIIDLRDQAASMSFAMDLSGEPQVAQQLGSTTMNMRMVMDHSVLYVKLPAAVLQSAPGLGGKPWLKLDIAKFAGLPSAGSLNNPAMSDPGSMLQYLRADSSSVSNEGRQQVDGVETTHYHAMLDLSNLASNLPPSEQSTVQQSLSQLEQAMGSEELPIDVWIDAQHFVRRIGMSLSMRMANGGTVQEAMTADLSDYGPQPQPKLPPDDQVQDFTNLIHIGS